MRCICRLNILGASLVLLASLAGGAAGDPVWRGTAGSTYQQWDFSTNANPASPELGANPYGTPTAAIDYEPPFGAGWKNSLPGVYGSAQGWWDIARGSITTSVASSPDIAFEMVKDIEVQVIYWKDINDAPSVTVTPSASFIGKTTVLIQAGPVGGAWYADTWRFSLTTNQNGETLTVHGHPTMGSQIDRVVADTRYAVLAASATQVRLLPEGTVCDITGPGVTRSFDTFFYLENRDRTSGIRVNCASGQAPAARDTAPRVTGVVRVIDGELVIDEAWVVPGGSGTVAPLGMCNKSVCSGLSPQGLLIRLWGRVSAPQAGMTGFLLDDGSGQPIRVEPHGTSAPPFGSFVCVTGAMGRDSHGPVLHAGGGDIAAR